MNSMIERFLNGDFEICCESEDEAEKFLEILNNKDCTWASGNSLTYTRWKQDLGEIYYSFHKDDGGLKYEYYNYFPVFKRYSDIISWEE